MKITITGRNFNVTDGLRDAVEGRLGKLDKYFAPETEARVTLSSEANLQKIEVTIPTKLGIVRGESCGYDMYASIDEVGDIIEKQIKKHKTKLIDKKQSAVSFTKAFFEEKFEDIDEEEIKIVKTKTFALKPMDAEEACLQMEMLGHNFFVFLNADTNQVNVVYKRKANSYGLIEPET